MARGQNREQILEAGMKLIYKRGYNASGVQEIAHASGVPKGSFYNYFKSKQDFVIQALDYYTENLSQCLENALTRGDGSPLARLKKLWDDWAEHQFSHYEGCGCFAGNMSNEMANHSPEIRAAITRSFARLEGYYRICLTQAQQTGEIAADTDTNQLATLIFNGWQGSLIRAKADNDPKQLIQYVEYVFTKILI